MSQFKRMVTLHIAESIVPAETLICCCLPVHMQCVSSHRRPSLCIVSSMDLSADWFNLVHFIIGWASFCTVCRVNRIGWSVLHISPKHRPTDIVYVCTPRPTHILLCPHYQLPNGYERSFNDEPVRIYNIGIMRHRPA